MVLRVFVLLLFVLEVTWKVYAVEKTLISVVSCNWVLCLICFSYKKRKEARYAVNFRKVHPLTMSPLPPKFKKIFNRKKFIFLK